MVDDMDKRLTALERAFQLARSGHVANTSDIKDKLKREGYDPHHLEGLTLLRQLRTIIKAARELSPDAQHL
jgi:hypothetical protein